MDPKQTTGGIREAMFYIGAISWGTVPGELTVTYKTKDSPYHSKIEVYSAGTLNAFKGLKLPEAPEVCGQLKGSAAVITFPLALP